MFRVPRLPRPRFEKGEQEWVRELCARASLQAEILSITPLPDNRRTPLAAVWVRLGDVEVVFNLAALGGQRRTVRPLRDQDGVEAVFLPEPVKAALDAAIIEAANAR